MKLFISVVALLLFVTTVFGQRTVSGIVTDASQNPLSDAKISVKGSSIKTSSQSDGRFSIDVPAEYSELEVSMENFRTKTLEITGSELTIVLESISETNLFDLSLEELMNVNVTTASKNAESLSKIPASVVVVQRSEIEKIGYKSIEELLQDVLGMYMIDDYCWNGSKNYGVRGFFSTGSFSNMVVLVNGVDQRCDVQFASYMTEKFAIPIQAVDRVEVVRGPMSVIYGSGAFFGAINIITNQAAETDKLNEVAVAGGNFENKELFIQFKGQGEGFSYSLHGSLYKDDGIDVPFSDFMTDASIATAPIDEGGWNLTTDHTAGLLRTNRKTLNFSGQFKDISANFGLVSSEKGTVESTFGAGDGHSLQYLSAYGSMRYDKQVHSMLGLTAKFDFTSDNHWIDDDFFYSNAATNNISRMNAYEVELASNFTPSEKLSILSGLTTHYIEDFMIFVDYPQFGYNDTEWTSEDVQTFSFYTQFSYSLTPKIQLIGGFRLEHIKPYTITQAINAIDGISPPVLSNYTFESTNSFDFVPRLAMVYEINNKNVLKLLYGKAIKEPSVTSQFDMIGTNKTLKSADIQTYELFYQSFVSSNVSISTSVFYNYLNNLISRINVIDGDGNITILSDNAGKNTTIGGEIGIKIKPSTNLLLDIKGIYQKSTDEREGYENIELAYSPNLLLYFNAVYTQKKFDFGVSGRFVSEMFTAWSPEYIDANQKPITPPSTAAYGGRIGESSPSHFNLSLNIRANELFNTGLYLNLNVSNLLDQKIYYPTTLSNPQFDKGTLGFGRWFNVRLGLQF